MAPSMSIASFAFDIALSLPESSELGGDQLLVADLSLERADLAGEPADVGDHLLGNGCVIEGRIARDLVGDETRLLGGKQALGGLDRKSTRLNSSHLGISYAVFCLKKKTKTSSDRYHK